MLEVEFCLAGIIFRVLLGPAAAEHIALPAACKMWHRSFEARTLAVSYRHSLQYYRCFAFLAKEARAMQLSTRTPWNSIAAECPQHLADFHFSFEAPSIERVAMAAAYRAAVRSAAFFRCLSEPPPDADDG
jgi:hypothetical protein